MHGLFRRDDGEGTTEAPVARGGEGQADTGLLLYCRIAACIFLINTVYPVTTKLLQE